MIYYLGIPTNSTINPPDKAGVFPSFSETKTLIASYFPYLSSDTFSLDLLAAIFDTCQNKVGEDEEEGMVWISGAGVPDKAGVFPSFSDTTNFIAYSVP